MIFPVLKVESRVQTGEKTRLNGIKSYTTPGEAAVSLVRIRPTASGSFITVSTIDPTDYTTWFLDWQYDTAGNQTIDLEITTNGAPVVVSKVIEVLNPVDERLFSSDLDIEQLEPGLLDFVKPGKNSFNDVHRQAQIAIMDEIYRNRILATDGSKLTALQVVDTAELKFWSLYMVLNKIFQGLSNKVDDVFANKSKYYASKEHEAMQMCMNQMRLDYNKDGTVEQTEQYDFRTVEMVRR